MTKSYVYIYHTGDREDGMDYAIGVITPAGDVDGDVALFKDKVDAHLFAHDKAERLGATVADCGALSGLGNGRFGWPLVLIRQPYKALRRGELTLACPECSSIEISISIRPGGNGTGPHGTWRTGDSGGPEYATCRVCGFTSDEPPARAGERRDSAYGHRQ